MLRKTLLANGRGKAGYKIQQWQDKPFVGINNLNSDQINFPLAPGNMDSICGSLAVVWPLSPPWAWPGWWSLSAGAAQLLWPLCGGTGQNDSCVSAKPIPVPTRGYIPDTFLAYFTRGWGLRLNQGCVCWETRSPIPSFPPCTMFGLFFSAFLYWS